MKFRDLRENEIDVRIGQVSEEYGYISLLLYKDARVDMNILDETVGEELWQRKHYELKGTVYCSVGIWFDGLNQWVWKDDCGSESYTEKEKGESSDSFKRACVNWGIGRELYTSPKITINCEFIGDKKKTPALKDFEVEKIKIENKVITGLALTCYDRIEKKRKRIFVWQKSE